jgi:hypothetical protein
VVAACLLALAKELFGLGKLVALQQFERDLSQHSCAAGVIRRVTNEPDEVEKWYPCLRRSDTRLALRPNRLDGSHFLASDSNSGLDWKEG